MTYFSSFRLCLSLSVVRHRRRYQIVNRVISHYISISRLYSPTKQCTHCVRVYHTRFSVWLLAHSRSPARSFVDLMLQGA